MSEWLKGWLASEETSHDKIEVKRIYIDLNEGNLYDGVMFSQIMYWHGSSRENGKPRMTIERDGHLWLAKGYGDWFVECRIGEATARQCISRIEKRGLIVKKLWKFNNTPTIHIRVDWDNLEEQLKWICYDISNGFDTTYQIGSDTTYQMNSTPDSKSLTDTTSDTTAKESSAKEIAEKKPRKPHKNEPWRNGLLAAFGLTPDTVTKTGDKTYWTAAADLVKINFPIERIPDLHRWCKSQKWESFTVMAMAKHAGEYLAKCQPTKIIPLDDEPIQYPDTADYVNLAGVSNGN